MRTRVKICGITRPEDAVSACAAGADAIGLVFAQASPRLVTLTQAQGIVAVVPPFVSIVGLFVDADEFFIRDCCERLPINLLQFHGQETDGFCSLFGVAYIKAVKIQDADALSRATQFFRGAKALLLDSPHPTKAGGTGAVFDWSLIPVQRSKPIILAGGLGSKNVSDAIHRVKPFAVDVSSGVETQPGIKDAQLIKQFMQSVHEADQHR